TAGQVCGRRAGFRTRAHPGRAHRQYRRLAARLTALLDAGTAPLVLGGDSSLLVAAGLALARRGRYGLVHVDGHTDFRHPGKSDSGAILAGEGLAAVVGRHWPAVTDLDGILRASRRATASTSAAVMTTSTWPRCDRS